MANRPGGTHRFSAWDGTQNPWGDVPDDLFDRISEDMFHGWDIESALRRLLSHGWNDLSGRSLTGLEEMMERLRAQRHQQLQRYSLDSVFADITEKLNTIVRRERAGIRERVDAANANANNTPTLMDRVAEQRLRQLDALPDSPSAAVRTLRDYEFVDPGAEQEFRALLDEIQTSVTNAYAAEVGAALRATTAEDVEHTRAMLHDLNALVRAKVDGVDGAELQQRYDEFRERHSDVIPSAPPTLDAFLEQLTEQMARMDSLMQSLPEDQRRELEQLAAQSLGDAGVQAEMAELMDALGMLGPRARLGTRHSFFGYESVGLDGAMDLMQGLQGIDDLERALRDVYRGETLSEQSRTQLKAILGEDALHSVDTLSSMTRDLETRGLVERGDDGLALTARGMRRIGHKALSDIFSKLAYDRFGDHSLTRRGHGPERADESRAYEFGAAFDLDLQQTVMNAVRRRGRQRGDTALLRPDDFVVHATEATSRAATVLMLDMSRSMPLRGYFYAAKKVALALDSLIRSQYPRDSLYIIGFSDYARQISPAALPQLSVNEYVYGTNLQHGLMLARRLLAAHPGANRQIIIVSDGEPTAHMEGGQAVFFYPPLPETFEKTLIEVRHCTRDGIVINTFMLESNRNLVQFVNQMTRLNRGRAFFISPDRLGDYVLVDFVRSRGGGPRAA